MDSIMCPVCNGDVPLEVPEQEVEYIQDFGQWENVNLPCPTCQEEGRNTMVVVNLNIPASEYEEQEVLEELYFPPNERTQRKKIRDFMWKIRPDLKQKNRNAYKNEAKRKFEEKFGKTKEEFIKERREQRGKPEHAGKNINAGRSSAY